MSTHTTNKGFIVLLTGGSGFLGTFIIRELLDGSSTFPVKELRVLDMNLLKGIKDERIKFVQGDVRDEMLLIDSCKGVDLVIHSAAIVDWGTRSKKEIMSVNEGGTQNVIEACRTNHVKAIVYTSSLDVLHDGSPLRNVNEETNYPESHSTSYCVSKYQAEKLIIEANSKMLWTCSLRPADIYGEGDPYHIGSLIQMAKGGIYVRLGNGKSICQHVYAGNVAHAHVQAARALLEGNQMISGQSYFITDGPPSNFFLFFERIIEGAGYSTWPGNLWLPRWFAYGLGCISEFIAFLWRPIKRYTPKMSRFAVVYTCTDYTFSSEKARNDFGFTPKYSDSEAHERTIKFFRQNDD